jgi:hypothetical protein
MSELSTWKESLAHLPKFSDRHVLASLGSFAATVKFCRAGKTTNIDGKTEGKRHFSAPYVWVTTITQEARAAARSQFVIVFEKQNEDFTCPNTNRKISTTWMPLIVPIGWCSPSSNRFVWPTGHCVTSVAGDTFTAKQLTVALAEFDMGNVAGLHIMHCLKFPMNDPMWFKEHEMFPASDLGIGPCKYEIGKNDKSEQL